MIEAFAQNFTVEGFINVLAALAQIAAVTIIPVIAWAFARRASAKIWIGSESQKILTQPGKFIWRVRISSRRSLVKDVEFLVRSHSSRSDIELVKLESRGKGIEIDDRGSYLFVRIPIIFADQDVVLSIKFSESDHPNFVALSKGIRIHSEISWPKRLMKKAVLLTAQQRLMILMLQFMIVTFIIVVAIIYSAYFGS